MKHVAIFLIRVYQATLAGLLGGQCRFQPSCSQYAIEALERHGLFRGAWLGLRRVGRCHPWHPGGVDPVPEKKTGDEPSSKSESTRFQPTPRLFASRSADPSREGKTYILPSLEGSPFRSRSGSGRGGVGGEPEWVAGRTGAS